MERIPAKVAAPTQQELDARRAAQRLAGAGGVEVLVVVLGGVGGPVVLWTRVGGPGGFAEGSLQGDRDRWALKSARTSFCGPEQDLAGPNP